MLRQIRNCLSAVKWFNLQFALQNFSAIGLSQASWESLTTEAPEEFGCKPLDLEGLFDLMHHAFQRTTEPSGKRLLVTGVISQISNSKNDFDKQCKTKMTADTRDDLQIFANIILGWFYEIAKPLVSLLYLVASGENKDTFQQFIKPLLKEEGVSFPGIAKQVDQLYQPVDLNDDSRKLSDLPTWSQYCEGFSEKKEQVCQHVTAICAELTSIANATLCQ